MTNFLKKCILDIVWIDFDSYNIFTRRQIMNKKTTFLVAENDFLSGVSRVLDIASTRNKRVYNTSRSGDEADKKAIFNDWFMIGNDIRGAYEQFKKEVKAQT